MTRGQAIRLISRRRVLLLAVGLTALQFVTYWSYVYRPNAVSYTVKPCGIAWWEHCTYGGDD